MRGLGSHSSAIRWIRRQVVWSRWLRRRSRRCHRRTTQDRNKARSRRKPQPLRFKPVTIGDLIRKGKLLEVHCGNCRPERHLYLNPEILRLSKRTPVPEVARHLVCSKCGARDKIAATKLANTGKLYVYSIVHRSFPGIQVPYISAIVDLDGGGTVKGNLIGIDPNPEKIKLGMPVDVVYKDALGRKDREGNSYISYFFQPRA